MDAYSGESRSLKAAEVWAIGPFPFPFAIFEVMRPGRGVLNLLYGEIAFRGSVVATALFVARIFSCRHLHVEQCVVAL